MRLCEHLRVPLNDLDSDEAELWFVWEQTFGALGARRGDILAAHAAQVAIATAPYTKEVPPLESLMVFRAKDWRDPEVIEQERRDCERERFMQMARAESAKERYKTLLAQGRVADWNKEVTADGRWLGPITDASMSYGNQNLHNQRAGEGH